MWLYLLALALIGLIVVVLLGRWEPARVPEEESPAAGGDDVDQLLSSAAGRPLTADDLDQVQFDSAVRGYRMDQVDKLIDALAAQLRQAGDGDDIPPAADR